MSGENSLLERMVNGKLGPGSDIGPADSQTLDSEVSIAVDKRIILSHGVSPVAGKPMPLETMDLQGK